MAIIVSRKKVCRTRIWNSREHRVLGGGCVSKDEIFYPEIYCAEYLRRLNRFVVECRMANKVVEAHLPNPGRMWELLFPGKKMYLAANEGVGKKTRFKVIGIEREGMPVMLDTHYSNHVAEMLIEQKQIPGWEEWSVQAREVTFGNSRIDLLLRRGAERFVVEVKSCTLFGNEIAMFPDAVTERGRRHISKLVQLADEGYRAGILFLIQWPRSSWFLPDYHTDLAFSQALYAARDKVEIKAVTLDWRGDFTLRERVKEALIPWELISREMKDSGNYIVVLRLEQDKSLSIGSKGTIHFPCGYYLYVGSAKQHLTKRLERHQRKRKRFHWHIDYLRQAAEFHAAIAIRTPEPLEHAIACALGEVADWEIAQFGSSDCNCRTHLFGMQADPLHTPAFIKVLQYFRMDRLEQQL